MPKESVEWLYQVELGGSEPRLGLALSKREERRHEGGAIFSLDSDTGYSPPTGSRRGPRSP